jgi:hypothetical protein
LTNNSRSGDFQELEKHVRQLRSELAAAWSEIDHHKRRWESVAGGKKLDTGQLSQRVRMHDLLVAHFDMGELMQICFDLGIMWDLIAGDNLDGKARSLILKMEREDRLYQLTGQCYKARPEVDWPTM